MIAVHGFGGYRDNGQIQARFGHPLGASGNRCGLGTRMLKAVEIFCPRQIEHTRTEKVLTPYEWNLERDGDCPCDERKIKLELSDRENSENNVGVLGAYRGDHGRGRNRGVRHLPWRADSREHESGS